MLQRLTFIVVVGARVASKPLLFSAIFFEFYGKLEITVALWDAVVYEVGCICIIIIIIYSGRID